MNRRFLAGAITLACLSVIIGVTYACIPIGVYISDYEKYVAVNETVDVTADVTNGGPATSWWWWAPRGISIDYVEENDYDSTASFGSDTAGVYEVWARAYNSSGSYDQDYADVYVVEIGLSDLTYINLGDPDPCQVVISLEPAELDEGFVRLDASDDIAVWYDSGKTNEVSLPASWSVAGDEVPASVWVEGTSVSSEVDDASLDVEYGDSRYTLVSNTVEFTVLNMQILSPTGTDFDDQFAFDSQTTGECSVSATGTTGITALNANLRWTLEGITGYENGANATFVYSGLPSSNSDFGYKTLTLEYASSGLTASMDVEIFFEPTATNHPGGGTPNWFYYWQNADVIPDDFEYDPDPSGNHPWGWFNEANEQLYLGPNATGPDWDPTANGWPDNTVVFTNHYYHTTINSGGNGIAQTSALNDDYQVVPVGSGGTPFSTIITWDDPNPNAGENDWMDSADDNVGGDDDLDLTDALTETNEYGKTGIDLVVVVCAHESKHKENYFLTGDDTDDYDGIPYSHEINSSYYLNPYRPDTYNVASIWPEGGYSSMGDDEFLSCMAEVGVDEVDPDIDWSKDGKQWHQP